MVSEIPYANCAPIHAWYSFHKYLSPFPLPLFSSTLWKVEYHMFTSEGWKSEARGPGSESQLSSSFFHPDSVKITFGNARRGTQFPFFHVSRVLVILAANVSERIIPNKKREREDGKSCIRREFSSGFKPIHASKHGFRCCDLCLFPDSLSSNCENVGTVPPLKIAPRKKVNS